MKHIAFAATLALFAAPAFASDESDIMAAISKMNAAMNKNDNKVAATAYTGSAAIIDEFAPHFWSGPDAYNTWSNDFAALAKKQGDTDAWVTTEKPLHVTVSGERGYAVVPAVYTFKEHGKKMTEHGLWTFAMQKVDGTWKIAAWSWALR